MKALSRGARWGLVAGVLGVALAAGAALRSGALQSWLVVANTPEYRPLSTAAARSTGGKVRLTRVAGGLDQPVDLQFVPGGGGQAVVLERKGTARLLDLSGAAAPSPNVVSPGPALLTVAVRTDSEMGLLGLAFHPAYRQRGLFYVNFTPADGSPRTRISEWRLPAGELGRKAAHDERVVLEVGQPYPNHNGGQLAFGPDGFLYVGLGDGGWRGDPHGNAQNLSTVLGKMLRIDVDLRTASAYGIPADNPFVGKAGARPEIWAFGLRNPWRYSFDRHGRIVAGDVGQDLFEEIDLVPRGGNLGWKIREATHCFAPKVDCPGAGLIDPVFEYGREAGSSVTGGYEYTGSSVPDLAGQYVLGDFVSGRIWALRLPGPDLPSSGLQPARQLGQWPILISSFGRDEQGEIYVLDYAKGDVYRLSP